MPKVIENEADILAEMEEQLDQDQSWLDEEQQDEEQDLMLSPDPKAPKAKKAKKPKAKAKAGKAKSQRPTGPIKEEIADTTDGARSEPPPKPKSEPKPKKASKSKKSDKLYPELQVKVAVGEDAVREADAKTLLGWTEINENSGLEIHLYHEDKPIHCAAIAMQRDIYQGLIDKYCLEILYGKWKLNGEPIIVGWFGHVIDGKHRLLAVIRAASLLRENQSYPYWDGKEPYIETVIEYGISEDQDVVNTLNTGKPRSIADALHAVGLFSDMPKKDRKIVARATEFAIKNIWDHIGVLDAYSPKKSNAEAYDFFLRHPHILDAIKYVWAEEPEISNTGISVGAASSLLYLMATSKSDPQAYYSSQDLSEDSLDFSLWDKACEFWMAFAKRSKKLAQLFDCLAKIAEKDDPRSYGIPTMAQRNLLYERTAFVCIAWNLWLKNKPVTANDLKVKYVSNANGIKIIATVPSFGGIDLGLIRE